MMGIEEGTCWDEHWVLYVSNEPRESTPKTKSTLYTLYVRQFDNKLYIFLKSLFIYCKRKREHKQGRGGGRGRGRETEHEQGKGRERET